MDSATSSAVSAPRSMPAGARSAAMRSSPTRGLFAQPLANDGRARRRGHEAHVGRRRARATADAPPRPRCPGWRRRRTATPPGPGPGCPSPTMTRSAPGNASASAMGSNHRHAPAGGRAQRGEGAGDRRGAERSRAVARAGAVPRRSPACPRSDRSSPARRCRRPPTLAGRVLRQAQQARLAVGDGRSASRTTTGWAQLPPTQPSIVPSGWMIPPAPGRADVGRRTATTVATTKERPAASSSTARAKVERGHRRACAVPSGARRGPSRAGWPRPSGA